MKITFELTDGRRFRFTKTVEMLAVPQLGTECDPDGNNFRAVKQVYHNPGEIVVWLELDQSDTPANLKKQGWNRDAVL